MKTRVVLLAIVTLFLATPVFSYDTGSMTCDDMGGLAMSIVMSKEKGMSLPVAIMVTMITKPWQLPGSIQETE